ncbi:MAG: TIGR02594 family protein [Polyangiales bacterium]
MSVLCELSFNGYRLDTRAGRKFDAGLVSAKDVVPEGIYTMENGTANQPYRPKQQSMLARDYGLKPSGQGNVTPRFHLLVTQAANRAGIRADPTLGALQLDGQLLSVRYSSPWMLTARAEVGQKEAAGTQANPRILEYFKSSGFWGTDDTGADNAWCASFVSWVLKQHGYEPPANAFRATAWAGFGAKITDPVYGAIGVKSRKGGGHVAFVVGRSPDGKQLYMLGGNQGDKVQVAKYARSDWTSFVYPAGASVASESLPVYKGTAAAAGSES